MQTVLNFIHLIVCVFLIVLILLQHGKGAEVGAAFGSGASQTVFGAAGSGNFLTRLTAILAATFFVISIALSYLAISNKQSALSRALPKAKTTQPAKKPASQPKPSGSEVPLVN